MGKKWYAVGRKWWLGILSPVTRTRPRVRARGRSRSSRKGEPIGAENTLRDTGWPFFTLRSALHPRPPPIRRRTLLFANSLQLTFIILFPSLYPRPISRSFEEIRTTVYLLILTFSILVLPFYQLFIPLFTRPIILHKMIKFL